jgi:proteasome accessory factor B
MLHCLHDAKEAVMERLENRVARLAAIERAIAQHPPGLTTGELTRRFHVDPVTIRRDIRELERQGAGLYKDGRRWKLDHRRVLYSVRFTPYELAALFIAVRLLFRYSDEHNPYVGKALGKLSDSLAMYSPMVSEQIALTAQATESRPPRPEYVEAFEALTRGWIERRKVCITYEAAAGSRRTTRVFSPYFIEPSGIGYATYAIGFDELRQKVRTLKLDRMHEAQVLDERFDIPAPGELQAKLANAWAVVWGDESHEDRLRFSAQVAWRIRESTWHPSQQIETAPDGSCILSVRIGSLLEIRPWIRQWGADVEVLEPKTLRAEMTAEAQKLSQLYGLQSGRNEA